MRYHNQMAIKHLSSKKYSFSERKIALESGISRVSLRHIMANDQNVNLKSIVKLATYLERKIHILPISDDTNTDLSTIGIAYKILTDGLDSWKIHLMDFVDEFRRTLDPQLLLLAPPESFPRKLKALLASTVVELCEETEIDPPVWASKMYFLDRPWFVSETQSLKAIALAESPLAFRRNNIFVHENFLVRV